MKIKRILLSLAACFLAISGTATAQDDDHGLINVRTTTVKTGKGAEYRELLATLAAARKAAGYSGVNVWQVVRGPTSTYYTVAAIDNYGIFDGSFDSGMSDGDWQRWLSRASGVVAHARVTTLRTHGELTIPAAEGSTPGLLRLRFTTLHSGNGSDHHDWLENELMPALKEGGREGWNVSDVRLGDVVNTWISATRLDSWAQLDEPGPLAQMDDADRQNMFDSNNERVQSSRVEVIRHLPEQSY